MTLHHEVAMVEAIDYGQGIAGGQPELLNVADPVQAYINSLGRIAFLNRQEEVETAKMIEVGLLAGERLELDDLAQSGTQLCQDLEQLVREGQLAMSRMVHSNLPLVISIAKHYVGQGVDLIDLIQEGNLGLIGAVRRFDYSRGFRFSTYAYPRIQKAIKSAIAAQGGVINLPIRMVENRIEARGAHARLLLKLGREPSDEELAEEVGVTVEYYRELIAYFGQSRRLDQAVFSDNPGGVVWGERLTDESLSEPAAGLEREEQAAALRATLAGLPNQRDAAIVRLYYGLDNDAPMTQYELGDSFGITPQRVGQIISAVIKRLQQSSPGLLAD